MIADRPFLCAIEYECGCFGIRRRGQPHKILKRTCPAHGCGALLWKVQNGDGSWCVSSDGLPLSDPGLEPIDIPSAF